MRRGESMMHGGKAVQVLAIGADGVSVRYLTSNQTATVPASELREASEPDAASRYNTGLTPGRVPQ